MKKFISILSVIFLCSSVQSQNITNTLGLGGTFTIKDNTTTFFSLSQASGNLSLNRNFILPNTSNSSMGVVFKDSERFLHNYQAPGTNGRNTFLGIEAGNFSMSGIEAGASYNTGIGHFTLTNLTNGNGNTAVGHLSMFFNQSGSSNTAVGDGAMVSNTTGNNNTAIGTASLYSNTTGNYNTALGFYSLVANTSGVFNTALGYYSLRNSTTGDYNLGAGFQSLYTNSTGNENTAIGVDALFSNTTGSQNTVLGHTAGYNLVSGTNVICIGYNSQPSLSTVSNEITLGNNQVTSLRCNVSTITSLSDARDKKKIKDLSLGLSFIMMLKPRIFNWDKREWYEEGINDGSKMQEVPTAGFIAQELDEAQHLQNAEWLNLVYSSNPEKLEATAGNLLPVMVKAIQELKEENDRLKQQVNELKEAGEKYAEIETMLNELKTQVESLINNQTKETQNAENR
jgi:trimeric autotransporter adhesin